MYCRKILGQETLAKGRRNKSKEKGLSCGKDRRMLTISTQTESREYIDARGKSRMQGNVNEMLVVRPEEKKQDCTKRRAVTARKHRRKGVEKRIIRKATKNGKLKRKAHKL